MANPSQTVILRGTTMYAKILGDPVLNYSKDGKEWTMDLVIDAAAVKDLKAYGLTDRVKSREDKYDGKKYVSFKQKELRPDGSANEPIKVVDIHGKPWGGALIGNGSTVDVKFVVRDYGPGKKKGIYPRAVRVLDLVEYGGRDEFPAVDEGDVFFDKAQQVPQPAELAPDFEKDFDLPTEDLDDEIPF